MVHVNIGGMTKPPRMTLDEARAILHRWDKRQPGERDLVLEADKLLAEAWEKRREEQRKKRRLSF
jgi:hypothetical protein